MFSFEMKSATIIHGSGPDYIFIKTNLPDACYPYEGPLVLQFTCAADGGEAYMKQHFPDVRIENVYKELASNLWGYKRWLTPYRAMI